jgi:phosphoserine phosphatase RsbU/P
MNAANPTPEPNKGQQSRAKRSSPWQRLSDGRRIRELWSQFTADARASYGFYGREVDWEEIKQLPRWRRPFRIAKELFVAMLMKLTPARRVLLVLALVLLGISKIQFRYVEHGKNVIVDIRFEAIAALIFLLLLSLELAEKVTMKRDMEIAKEIQRSLVPSEAPAIPGANVAFAIRPQNSVAGDFYDAFYPQAGGKLLLAIADVAGKSIPAALLMASFQASLHTIAVGGATLGELVSRLNGYIFAHSLGGQRFTTAVLSEFDPLTRELIYVNSGHNAPVLRRKAGNLERLEASGLPLGIQQQAAYAIAAVQMGPGDALILYTDGVTDAVNERGEELGDERWLSAVRSLADANAADSLQFLMRHVDEFVKSAPQFDDITCLVLRCV